MEGRDTKAQSDIEQLYYENPTILVPKHNYLRPANTALYNFVFAVFHRFVTCSFLLHRVKWDAQG